ncbi:Glutathione S-transferase [Filomicrobium insigne]|uniref:Glutathione S-transferase n=1 Tax=Filomicrobium insigne TaxID=418854 RepID=A0A1H0T626_9HYPH|nr:glutathione S-transferase [Filomicrobium insigne]SDP49424.1 Glutathione S-transferase [Filomicrobium insigne]
MKILDTTTAPNPRRVRIFLAEKGLSVPFEPFEMNMTNLRSEEFTAMNPMQRVPILVLDDGTCISESVAICRYFEESHPEPPLFGTGALGKALVEMWNRRMELNFFTAVGQAFRHLHPNMREREVPQVAEWGEANKAKCLGALKILDDQLANTQYVAGENYSIADITGLVAVDFMKVARIDMPDTLSNVQRWYNEVSARPSAKA